MRIADAIALVGRLSYKPGWELLAYDDKGGNLILRFGKDEPDCEKKDAVRPLMYTAPVSAERLDGMDDEAFLRFVFEVVRKRELHEVEEWLRLDGAPLYEPHPDVYRRGVLGDGTSLQQPE